MTIKQDGEQITGTYDYKDGKIEGVVSGNEIIGTWIQSNARGKIIFTMLEDGKSFTGKWGYNEDTPSGKWNGTRVTPITYLESYTEETPMLWTGDWNTDFSKMTLRHRGNKIIGTYEYKDGKIEGTVKGNTLSGMWIQSNANGKFIFIMSEDGKSFSGKWGYNNDTPSGKWNGTRIE
jgi:hypothetical protein